MYEAVMCVLEEQGDEGQDEADAEQRWLVAEIERSNTEFDSYTKDDARGSAGRERAREKKMRHAHELENLKDEAIEAYVQTRITEASEDNVELHAEIVRLHRRLEEEVDHRLKAFEVMNKHAEDTNEYANALLRAAKGEQKVSETYKAVAALVP